MAPGLAAPAPTRLVAGQAELILQALTYPFETVLDIGTGSGAAARAFHAAGKAVTATGFDAALYSNDPMPPGVVFHADVDVCDLARFADASFDAVWCAHVLEHTLNPGGALAEIRRVLKPGGYLFLTVPPFKHGVVGGHLTPGWNVGILMQVLLHAGFDVRRGAFIRHLNNIGAFVQAGEPPPVALYRRNGDLERARDWLPPGIEVRQGFDGDLDQVNWTWRVPANLRRTGWKHGLKRALARRLSRLL